MGWKKKVAAGGTAGGIGGGLLYALYNIKDGIFEALGSVKPVESAVQRLVENPPDPNQYMKTITEASQVANTGMIAVISLLVIGTGTVVGYLAIRKYHKE